MADETPADRLRFDQKAAVMLRPAIEQAALAIPELEAVAIVYLWRYPDQAGIPSFQIVGADSLDSALHPDALARLQLTTSRLQVWLQGQLQEGVAAIREYAANVARGLDVARQRPAADPGPGQAQAEAPDGPVP